MFIRPYIAILVVIIDTVISGIAVIITGLFDVTGSIYHLISKVWSNTIFLGAGVKVKIEGLDHLERNTSYIFMSNHLSHLDTPALMARLPFKIRFFVKKELLKIPIFGQAIYMGKHVVIDRKNTDSAKKSINDAKKRIKKMRLSILVFPEGTRSKTGKMGEFKKGGFVLAIETGLSVVPVAIQGSFQLLPTHTLLIQSGTINIKVGSPIPVHPYSVENKQELMDKVRFDIEKLGEKAAT